MLARDSTCWSRAGSSDTIDKMHQTINLLFTNVSPDAACDTHMHSTLYGVAARLRVKCELHYVYPC
jgi:hypothetical protein